MRLLMLPRYEQLGASSRLRMYQYIPALTAAGIEVTVSPFFRDEYVRSLYSGRRSYLEAIQSYARRIFVQLSASRFDVVWIEKELLPWFPASVERLRGGAAVVVDYDDAVFHSYDQHSSKLVRRLLGHRVDHVMRQADVVTAGNEYLAARAKQAGCRQVEQVPTVVDLHRYVPQSDVRPGEGVVIGWIGSPATAHYLHAISPVVQNLAARYGVRAMAVGARSDQVAGTPFEAIEWSEEAEASLISGFDIGVMPLQDALWERGKCGYKLIQYMACGLPVVASPVGVNNEIVQPGVNGYLAGGANEWEAALSSLVVDPRLRNHMGGAGRKRVENWYALQAQAPRIVEVLRKAVEGSAP